MDRTGITSFSDVYQSFLSKITDDMYMELTKEDTEKMLEELLVTAIHKFEFPRVNLNDYVLGTTIEPVPNLNSEENQEEITSEYQAGYFNLVLTSEEINILSTYMIVEWLGFQLASIENVRMKYSGTDFKFTSQANHMQKLLLIKKDYEREGFHLQRLYKRRLQDINGVYHSTLGDIMNVPQTVWMEEVPGSYLDRI